MRFCKLTITNFRSIGPEGLEITFSKDRNLAAVIGPNASGKTNIVSALGIVLGMYPFSRFSPEPSDVHMSDPEGELLIELHLSPPITEHDVYRKEFEIAGFRYRVRRYKSGERKGSFHSEHYCFDSGGKDLLKPVRIYRQKGKAADAVDNRPRPVAVGDQAWKVGHLFYLDPPTLERFFDKTTGWSPLGRLFEIYRDDFQADHNVYRADKDTELTSREALQKFSARLADILRTPKLAEIEDKLSSRVAEYLGATSDQPLRVEFSLPSHRELFERWVTLQVSEHKGVPPLPIERLGSGYRALLRLAVLETLLDFQEDERTFVLLVEEPEAYLHVHLKRYFYLMLRRLAERGHQVIYTTHSPQFVDLAEAHEIIRLHRRLGESTVADQIAETTHLDFRRVKRKIAYLGNEELAFANYAILTEGQDDQAVLQELLARKGINPDVHSISVINCGGAGQIKDYVQLCSGLGINFYVVHDQDDQSKTEIKKRNEEIEAAVRSADPIYPSIHTYSPTLEAAMGTEKEHNNIDHLLELLADKDFADISRAYPDLVKPVVEFAATRGMV